LDMVSARFAGFLFADVIMAHGSRGVLASSTKCLKPSTTAASQLLQTVDHETLLRSTGRSRTIMVKIQSRDTKFRSRTGIGRERTGTS
ncbi:MAG: hypothetical protein ABJA33_13670, partial [Pedococcus sp.]